MRQLFIIIFILLPYLSLKAQLLTEEFDNNTQYSITQGGEGNDGTADYFQRTDGSNINKTYTGASGTNFFAAQDIDDGGWGGSANPSQLTWSGINISGFTNLQFSGLFASVATTNIDASDFVLIEYNIDGGGWNDLLAFENAGGSNNQFQQDTDFDGTGDGTMLSSTFTTFNANLVGSGSSLDLRITVSVNAGDEDFAFDQFIITGSSDATPPTISVVTPVSSTELDVLFSESVDLTTAQMTNNYSLNNSFGNPSSAIRDGTNLSLVHLTYASAMPEGQAFTLTVNNVQDIAGNAMSSQNINFNSFTPISGKKVVINEIFADESPVVGLPSAEYVELFNPQSMAIDITNWTLGGAGSSNADSDPFPSFSIPAQGYMILTANGNTSLFSGNVIGIGTSTTLTNSGETLTLKDDNGDIIDQITYSTALYQDDEKENGGYSLELINPFLNCTDLSNWTASNNASGGTPGTQNSVFDNTPDTTAPTLTLATAENETSVFITFSEAMETGGLSIANNYNFNNGVSISTINVLESNQQVRLSTSSLSTNTAYTLTLNNLQDCSGNALSENTITFFLGESPTFNEVLITEIFADPEPSFGLPNSEYIEIYNPSSNKVISLNECVLSDENGSETFPNQNLEPQEYAIVCDVENASLFTNLGRVITLADFPSLTNSGEILTLTNAQNSLLFTITYNDAWHSSSARREGGYSLEMIDVASPCGEESNWASSENTIGGTPGQVNSIQAVLPDNSNPKIQSAFAVVTDTIEVRFSEKMDSLSLVNATYQVNNGIAVDNISIISPDFKRVQLKVSPNLEANTTYQISIQNISDCAGNRIGEENTASFKLVEEADSTDILLNEVLFNPRTGGSDFVEFYNNSDKYINLKNWEIANVDEANIPDNRQVISETNLVLAPQEYLVLTTDALNIQSEYPDANADAFLELTSMPSLGNDEGTVLLLNEQVEIFQRLDYEDDFHNDLLEDENGVSLERISWTNETNNRQNWTSAGTRVGFATPGYLNSQSTENPLVTDNQITLDTKVFTPDGDGNQDVVTINYNFTNGQNISNILIYDKTGRQVKQIAQSTIAGTSGFYVWDGSNDNGQKVPMGYYIIFVEAFDAGGGKQTFKESVVVGTRF